VAGAMIEALFFSNASGTWTDGDNVSGPEGSVLNEQKPKRIRLP